jgi:S-adenosylmethionine hydrolase
MIVLLTDFGQSEYVGVMKAILYGINAEAKIVDLCHTIKHQNIIEASWILKNNYNYFPEDSVFCCIVDPGVGTERKAVAVRTDKYFFVAPDNGLIWPALTEQQIVEIRQIPITPDACKTFHGRDVFAKTAALIDRGGFEQIGSVVKNIEKMQLHLTDREGIVVRTDHFGNIVTNIPKLEKKQYSVTIDDKVMVMPFYPTYFDAQENELFLIEGSNNTLEISLKNGSANNRLKLKPGLKIKIG